MTVCRRRIVGIFKLSRKICRNVVNVDVLALGDAFGCVAVAAMTPIISIQISGLIYKLKANRAVRRFVAEEEYFIDYEYDVEGEGRNA